MENADPAPPGGTSISSGGDTHIDGNIAGRDHITHTTVNIFAAQVPPPDQPRKVRLTVHVATFLGGQAPCYFVNATNLSEREVEITHVWFAGEPDRQILNPSRPLPKRLKPDESWETWIEVYRIPDTGRDPYTLARARLSSQEIIVSSQNENVPNQGFVSGNP